MATLYENYNTNDDNNDSLYGATWKSQTFTVTVSHTSKSAKLKLFRLGSPGTITVSVRATDGSGHPTGADLCSGTLDGNGIATTPGEWYEISFGAGALLAAQKYAIVVRALSGDGSNSVNWRCDATSPTYVGGNRETSTDSGVSWTAGATRDFMFEDWGDGIEAGGGGGISSGNSIKLISIKAI